MLLTATQKSLLKFLIGLLQITQKNYTNYQLNDGSRFKVYIDYRLVKAYQKICHL